MCTAFDLQDNTGGKSPVIPALQKAAQDNAPKERSSAESATDRVLRYMLAVVDYCVLYIGYMYIIG